MTQILDCQPCSVYKVNMKPFILAMHYIQTDIDDSLLPNLKIVLFLWQFASGKKKQIKTQKAIKN